MRIEIIRTYPEEDLEFAQDAVEVELIVDGKVILNGDYYHDKIDEKIEGFLFALDSTDQKYSINEINQNEA